MFQQEFMKRKNARFTKADYNDLGRMQAGSHQAFFDRQRLKVDALKAVDQIKFQKYDSEFSYI